MGAGTITYTYLSKQPNAVSNYNKLYYNARRDAILAKNKEKRLLAKTGIKKYLLKFD